MTIIVIVIWLNYPIIHQPEPYPIDNSSEAQYGDAVETIHLQPAALPLAAQDLVENLVDFTVGFSIENG